MEKLPNINVIYEDNHLLVVEKPINMPVCEDSSGDIDFLSLLKSYIKIKYNKPNNVYLGLVHRLDRPVGGIMVFAKTSKCAARLSKQISEHSFEKTYYAVVTGRLYDKGRFEDYLIKDHKSNIVRVTNSNEGKIAILDYVVIKRKDNFNLVRINLKTGRSHQIRVQFSSRGNPLVGDHRYNMDDMNSKVNIALFAKSICFKHPISNDKMFFELELPKRYPFNLF